MEAKVGRVHDDDYDDGDGEDEPGCWLGAVLYVIERAGILLSK